MNSDDYCPHAALADQTVLVVTDLADGIQFVGTDQTGGFLLSEDIVAKVPEPWRRNLRASFIPIGSIETAVE